MLGQATPLEDMLTSRPECFPFSVSLEGSVKRCANISDQWEFLSGWAFIGQETICDHRLIVRHTHLIIKPNKGPYFVLLMVLGCLWSHPYFLMTWNCSIIDLSFTKSFPECKTNIFNTLLHCFDHIGSFMTPLTHLRVSWWLRANSIAAGVTQIET